MSRMFVLSVKASKSRMIPLIFCLALIAALILAACIYPAERTMIASTAPSGHSDEACAAYIKTLGYSAELPAVSVRHIRLPDTFDKALTAYNALQTEVGFDLTDYAGMRVQYRTYDLAETPTGVPSQIHLYVYDGRIIGGDISAADGSTIAPLLKAEGPRDPADG